MLTKFDIEKIYTKLKHKKGGKNADYIPELKNVNPNLYAISIYMLDGTEINVGDYQTEFALECCSKVCTLATALDLFGTNLIESKIGSYVDHKRNTYDALIHSKTHSTNSFDNSGSLILNDLLLEKKMEKNTFMYMNKFAGRKLYMDKKIFHSEFPENSKKNLAIAQLLYAYNIITYDPRKSVEMFIKQCSIMATTRDLALMAATIANDGIQPITKKRLVQKKNISYILRQLELNGMYKQSEMWMEKVGYPGKSGIGGMIMIIIPGQMGIGITSSPVNKYMNSYKGLLTAIEISKCLKKK